MTDPDQPTEEPPAESLSQLSESLKICHKLVGDYRAALLKKPRSVENPPKRD